LKKERKDKSNGAGKRTVWGDIKADLNAAMRNDPAARSKFEVALTYAGFHALVYYRVAHALYRAGLRFLARVVSQRARFRTGVEIHPAAVLGRGILIDHGVGVVIGETAEVGDNVVIYQGVTLGGTGKDKGKRHPTVGSGVMIGAGAKVLGPITIGDNSKVGAGSVVLKDVPPNSTVVGVPGRIDRRGGERVTDDLDQIRLPDPTMDEFEKLQCQIEALYRRIKAQEAAGKAQTKTGKKDDESKK